MQQVSDPYRALGVSRDATEADIKAAHRKLVKRYHPDTGEKTDATRFLRVQEAYRVLSDPLLRREWDARHTSSPVRADRPATPPTRRRARPAGANVTPPPPRPNPPEAEPAESSVPPREREADARTRPRSSRSYTWSASEVPWWEDSGTKSESRTGTRRRARPTTRRAEPNPRQETDEPRPAGEPRGAAPNEPVFNAQQDFDVYNRSSGAAWSMAARAYFRRGDADLPRRGSFHHEGSQPLTAGRARTAAEAEARRRAAAAATEPAAAAPEPAIHATRPAARAAASASDANEWPSRGTTTIVHRSLAAPWPTLTQRFGLALVAWIPIAALIAIAAGQLDDVDQLVPMTLIALALAGLLAVPRIAYVAALATLLALVIGGLFIASVVFAGPLPSLDRIGLFVGGLLIIGYLGTGAAVIFGPATFRPWAPR